jgi:hypothetical protein
MIKGEISNDVENRLIYVVWEGMLAVPSENYTAKKFARRARYLHPDKALNLYTTNSLAVNQIWELWGTGQPVAIVTYLHTKFLDALAARLQRESVPHTRLIATSAREMSHTVALDPACLYLVDAEPLRQLTYGPKGRYLEPHNAQLIGRML